MSTPVDYDTEIVLLLDKLYFKEGCWIIELYITKYRGTECCMTFP